MSIIVLFFLIVESSSSCVVCTTPAQSPTVASAAANRATLSISLFVFLFALFLTAFLSLYVSYCSYDQRHQLPQTTRGIDPRVLATFPVMSYSAVKTQNAEFQCAVCLAEFDDGDALRLLPRCGHVFHPPCIDAWLAAHVTCPMCRGEVTVKIEDRHCSKISFGVGSSGIEGEGEGRAQHVTGLGVLSRSHSTGHSLESFTLSLSEEMLKKLLEESERASVMTRMKRSASYDVVFRSMEPVEGSSNNNRWILSLTPPSVSRVSDLSKTACSGIPRF